MGKAILTAIVFTIAPFLLLFSLLFHSFLSFQKHPFLSFAQSKTVAYAALPTFLGNFQDSVHEEDARIELVRKFFDRYNSSLEPYALDIVEAADVYSLDFRLLPAIAMQESNLCRKAPANSYNCWGFGIYGKKVRTFANYNDAITQVTKTLAKSYKQNGLETPEEIMTKYTPSSNGSWARGVNHFMNQLE